MIATGRYLARSRSNEHIGSVAESTTLFPVTIIDIRPFRNGWQVCESAGMQPMFLSQEKAIDYAKGRACFRSGEIRVLDSNGSHASFNSMKPLESVIRL